jgi:hypothetical protein
MLGWSLMVGRSTCTSDQGAIGNGSWLIVVNHMMRDKGALVAESTWARRISDPSEYSTIRENGTGLTSAQSVRPSTLDDCVVLAAQTLRLASATRRLLARAFDFS